MVKKKKYLIPFGVALSSLPLMAWQSTQKQTATPANPSATVTPDEDSVVCSLLRQQAVYNNDFVRNTFYTWTTAEQIEELRKQPTLLTRSQSKTGEISLFDLSLRDSTFAGNPIAKVLSQDKFKNKRFGWVSAWATIMGWQKEKYGDQLLKITLKDDAIIGSFDQSSRAKPFCFYNMKGDSLTTDYVIKNQDKIAVMYHINDKKFKRTEAIYKRKGTSSKFKHYKYETVNASYREYVIMNEAMIKSWSYGTTDIIAELNSEIKTLQAVSTLLQHIKYTEPGYRYGVYMVNSTWEMENHYPLSYNGIESISATRFRTCTCIENDYYLMNKGAINAIIANLQKSIKAQSQPVTSK